MFRNGDKAPTHDNPSSPKRDSDLKEARPRSSAISCYRRYSAFMMGKKRDDDNGGLEVFFGHVVSFPRVHGRKGATSLLKVSV